MERQSADDAISRWIHGIDVGYIKNVIAIVITTSDRMQNTSQCDKDVEFDSSDSDAESRASDTENGQYPETMFHMGLDKVC